MTGEVALCGRGCCYIRSSLFSRSPWEFTATAAATLMRTVSRKRPAFLACSSSKASCVLLWVHCIMESESECFSPKGNYFSLQLYLNVQ